MKRRHDMPFGAALEGLHTTRFRLWAPAASRVDVELSTERTRRSLPLRDVAGDGWFEARVSDAPAGTRYAYRIDERTTVPDPASRFNPEDVHAASEVIDPLAFDWPDEGWRGRPWEEAILYELHLGTFTPSGTFAAAAERLDHLCRLGVSAIELMPVADFPGKRNWGYDGVLPFAPDAAYGTPQDFKRFIAAAHARGLMVLLDVVYNHFGPEGNYLHLYAPQFFNARHQTPWGAAINFDGERARNVREFFIHNALYWLEEFHLDGLRLDAVHAIADDSQPHILAQLTEAVHAGPGRERHVHIVLENDNNEAWTLGRDAARRPLRATAQWNDDVHHALHVIATGEQDGYYADYAARPLWMLGRALAEGFAYQGDASPYRGGERRGEPSVHLPATAFITFLQTHDQVGNRALGERIATIGEPQALRLAVVCTLLAPSVPLIFMGEEFAASTPFLFFCDFGPALAEAVREGRRGEFGKFERFRDPQAQAAIPDPNDAATFSASKLKWEEIDEPVHREWLSLYTSLLELRRSHIVPRLARMTPAGGFELVGASGLAVDWTLGDGSRLHLAANFGAAPLAGVPLRGGEILFASELAPQHGALAAWSAVWRLEGPAGA